MKNGLRERGGVRERGEREGRRRIKGCRKEGLREGAKVKRRGRSRVGGGELLA